MKNARILVVDDESLVRCSLKERLERDGHHVLAADSGRQALARLRDGVDPVLLDYRLPDTDGLGVRATYGNCATPSSARCFSDLE